MARLPKDVVMTSKPVRTFPNGDYLFIELSRTNGHYDCLLKMAQAGKTGPALIVARAIGKTIREAERQCYELAIDRCPRFPSPPYVHRGSGASRTRVG
jgi:hypothetical protein